MYSLRFRFFIILDFFTQIKKTFNFIYLFDKNIIINTLNHISTNQKINKNIKSINFALKL